MYMKSAYIIVRVSLLFLSVLNVNAQSSEQEIRNRYQRRIEQEQQKLENLRQSLREAYEELKQYDPNYSGGGLMDDNYGKQLTWIEMLKRDIEWQSALLESLPQQRDEEIRKNRELEDNLRRIIEQQQRQQQIDQQKANQARIQQNNQQRQRIENAKREQRREQVRINAKKQAEREERLRAERREREQREREQRERERRERERKERERQQQLYHQAYSQSMARSATSFERKMAYADAQRERMPELIEAQIDHIPTYSGYVSSSQSGATMRPSVRSKVGILPKRDSMKSDPLSDWPYKSRIPITQYPDPAYQPKFELIEVPRTSIFHKKSYDQVVWDSLRANCSENQYLLLLHTVREMNGGKFMPKVLGFNKAGNIVMMGDDKNIFSVTPDGNRIFFTKLDEHDFRTENIIKKIESGEPLVTLSAKGQAFGKSVTIKKDDNPSEEELEDNEHRFEGMKVTTSKKEDLSKWTPSAEAKAVIDLMDVSSTMTMNYVRLGDNHAWDFELQVVGGQKVTAEAKADFNLVPDKFHAKKTDFGGIEVMSKETYKYEGTPEIKVRKRGVDDMGEDVTKKTKVGFSAGISADLLKAQGKVKYSYIEDVDGRKFVITRSVGGDVGSNAGAKFKASTKKLQVGSFLFAGVSWDVTKVEVVDDKKWREW